MSERGRNSAEHLAVGSGLLATGAVARHLVGRDERKRKMSSFGTALFRNKLTRRHGGHLAVRAAARGASAAGLPLAAYGAYTAVRAKQMPARKLDYKADVVKPFAEKATYRDLANTVHNKKPRVKETAHKVHESMVAKRDLTRAETTNLVQRKERGRKISTAAGVMGLSALALRAPEAAKFVATKTPRAAKTVGRLARREPSATKASNALGVLSIGTGSAGSLNYAAQQRLEAKAVEKRDDRFLRKHRDRISPEAEKGYEYLRRGRNTARGQSADNAFTAGALGLVSGAGLVGGAIRREMRLPRNKWSTGIAVSAGLGAGLAGAMSVSDAKKAHRWNSKMKKIKAKGRERAAQGVYGRGRMPAAPEVEKALFRRGPSRFDRKVDRTMDAAASRVQDTSAHTINEAQRAASKTIGEAERSGMRMVNHASGKAGKLIALGSLGLTAATTTPVYVNHRMKRRAVSKAMLVPRVRVPGGSLMRKPSIKASHIGTSASGRKFTVRGSVG